MGSPFVLKPEDQQDRLEERLFRIEQEDFYLYMNCLDFNIGGNHLKFHKEQDPGIQESIAIDGANHQKAFIKLNLPSQVTDKNETIKYILIENIESKLEPHIYSPAQIQDRLDKGLVKIDASKTYISFEDVKLNLIGNIHAELHSIQDKLKDNTIHISLPDSNMIDAYISICDIKDVYNPQTEQCFAATAVYQDSMAPQVNNYRWFRDNILSETKLGRTFTDWYYNGNGEKMAIFVNNHPWLRNPLKQILNQGSKYIEKIK